jgi:hypothetical protein
LLADRSVGSVVVVHRDRLAGMTAELVEAALAAAGRRLVVVEAGEVADDCGRDLVQGLTAWCAVVWPPVGAEPGAGGVALRRACRWAGGVGLRSPSVARVG